MTELATASSEVTFDSVVVLSELDWESPHSVTFSYAQRFARRWPVIYVERPLTLAHAVRHRTLLSRMRARVRASARQGNPNRISDNLWLLRPWPTVGFTLLHPVLSDRYYRRLSQRIRATLHHVGVSRPLLWIVDPSAQSIIGQLGESHAIYHCIQDYSAAALPGPVQATRDHQERLLVRRVDSVLAQTPGLAARHAKSASNVLLFPSAVDLERFSFDVTISASPEEQGSLSRPRIGWVGMVSRAVDVELLCKTAAAYPSASMVIIGGIQEPNPLFDKLLALPNVKYLGFRPHSELPQQIAALDVCLIPYVQSDFVNGVSSQKLFEYLALGKNVVCTRYPEVTDLEDAMWIADDHAQFVRMVNEAANAKPSDEQVRRRREISEQHSLDSSLTRAINHLSSLVATRPIIGRPC